MSVAICPWIPLKARYLLPTLFFLQLVQAFTHAPATLEADKGGKFHLVDGNVTGEFTDLVSASWPRPGMQPLSGQKNIISPFSHSVGKI